jgi:hypothetical protein
MTGVGIPVHTYGSPEHDGHAGLLTTVMVWRYHPPDPHPGEGPEVSRAEVLFSDHRDGQIPKGPCPYIGFQASVTPAIFHDQTDEADPAEAEADPYLFGAGLPR